MDRLKEYQHNPPATAKVETNPAPATKKRRSSILSIEDIGQCSPKAGRQPQLPDEDTCTTSNPTPTEPDTSDDLEGGDDVGHYGVIFDDMNFKHLHREAQLAIIDVYDDTDIHIRYSVAHLPEGTPRILTTNLHPSDVFLTSDPAIKRRLQVIEVHCDLSETPRRMIYFPLKL